MTVKEMLERADGHAQTAQNLADRYETKQAKVYALLAHYWLRRAETVVWK